MAREAENSLAHKNSDRCSLAWLCCTLLENGDPFKAECIRNNAVTECYEVHSPDHNGANGVTIYRAEQELALWKHWHVKPTFRIQSHPSEVACGRLPTTEQTYKTYLPSAGRYGTCERWNTELTGTVCSCICICLSFPGIFMLIHLCFVCTTHGENWYGCR
jgi:hypothetical protein